MPHDVASQTPQGLDISTRQVARDYSTGKDISQVLLLLLLQVGKPQ
jgi:hypothetical protein